MLPHNEFILLLSPVTPNTRFVNAARFSSTGPLLIRPTSRSPEITLLRVTRDRLSTVTRERHPRDYRTRPVSLVPDRHHAAFILSTTNVEVEVLDTDPDVLDAGLNVLDAYLDVSDAPHSARRPRHCRQPPPPSTRVLDDGAGRKLSTSSALFAADVPSLWPSATSFFQDGNGDLLTSATAVEVIGTRALPKPPTKNTPSRYSQPMCLESMASSSLELARRVAALGIWPHARP
ncbi:hypothetical protein BD626DRAFT_589175, partial [Schizophyllum amplum]